jgi:formylmethanofuran dehydrogenase subunit A
MALQDGMVLALQANTAYNTLVATNSTVPVGAVKNVSYPMVVYHQGTIQDLADTKGSTGYRTARVQFDAYSAKSYTEAKAIAKAIRGVFQNNNNVTLTDSSSTFVQSFFVTQESDLTMIPQGALTVEYRVMVEITASYKES